MVSNAFIKVSKQKVKRAQKKRKDIKNSRLEATRAKFPYAFCFEKKPNREEVVNWLTQQGFRSWKLHGNDADYYIDVGFRIIRFKDEATCMAFVLIFS